MKELVLATRGSALARVQARMVRAGLTRAWPELAVREEVVLTSGDERPEVDLAAAGGSGLFTKELEKAVRDGRAHAAVHSLKDLPVVLPDGLTLGAVLKRGNPADVLVSRQAGGLDALPGGARIGTGSPRRAAMLRLLRATADVVPVRGNVPTRLTRVAEGKFDAVILAAAGLERLGLVSDGSFVHEGVQLHVRPLPTFLPAPGQAAIAVEVRTDDASTRELVAVLDDAATATAVRAERAVLRGLGGGCHLALGALAEVEGTILHLRAVLFDGPPAKPKMTQLTGTIDEAEEIGREAARRLGR